MTIHQLQKICGFLNFLGRAIIPGCAFTRRLYSHLENNNLRPHHHIRITDEMRQDLTMWQKFLSEQTVYCRDFMDFASNIKLTNIYFAMDASKNSKLGFGGHCGTQWMQAAWGEQTINELDPSIAYLELFALVAGVLAWVREEYRNKFLVIFSDNKNVKAMVNKSSTGCRNCMVLVRILVLHCLNFNIRLKVRYLESAKNKIADSLSRFQSKKIHKTGY